MCLISDALPWDTLYNYPPFLGRGNFSPIRLTLRWSISRILFLEFYFTNFIFFLQNSTWRFLRKRSAALPTTHRPNWTLPFWSSEGSFLLRTCSTPSSMIITYSPDPITNSDFRFPNFLFNQKEHYLLFCCCFLFIKAIWLAKEIVERKFNCRI